MEGLQRLLADKVFKAFYETKKPYSFWDGRHIQADLSDILEVAEPIIAEIVRADTLKEVVKLINSQECRCYLINGEYWFGMPERHWKTMAKGKMPKPQKR